MERDLEIVGLKCNTNGQSCEMHDTCGEQVKEGDVLILLKDVVDINGSTEEAVKCVRLVDGSYSCTVAFVPRAHVRSTAVQQNINCFIQVLELYDGSKDSMKRRKSNQHPE